MEFENPVIANITDLYSEIFMKHKWDMGKTDLLKHEIITSGKQFV